MIFGNDQLAFRVLDVLDIRSRNFRKENKNRHFCALSFRMRTDAVIRCTGVEMTMQNDSVTFFPADVDYYREATVDDMFVFHLELFNYSSTEIETFVTSRPQEVEAQFRVAYTEWMKNRPDRQYRVTGMLYQLFGELHTEYLQQEKAYSPVVMKALRFMSRHFAESAMNVQNVAAHVSVSVAYLRRLFQREVQAAPKEYLTRLRMQYAASLLTSGYYSVTEVAQKAGFADEKYFAVAFKRAYGCSPSHYLYRFDEP